MKKYLVYILIIGLPLLVGCKKKPEPSVPVEQSLDAIELPAEALEPRFESQKHGFKVQGPAGWAKVPDNLGMLVTYVKPGNPESFQENIGVARELKGELDLPSYAATTLKQIKDFFPEHEILGETKTTVNGAPAMQLRYQIKIDDLSLIIEQLTIQRPHEFLLITYTASPKTFEASYPALQQVLESIKFEDEEL